MKPFSLSDQESLWDLATTHYENFPVSPRFFSSKRRQALKAIYAFARTADDIADDASIPQNERLFNLRKFKQALSYVEGSTNDSPSPFFTTLKKICLEHQLPISAFYDLLSAFEQDVIKSTYQDIDEVIDYCQRSACPVGALVLALYKEQKHTHASESVCIALQLINFAQDIDSDLKDRNRCYIPLCDLAAANLTLNTMLQAPHSLQQQAIAPLLEKAQLLLIEGQSLANIKPFTLRLYCRCVIESAAILLDKLARRTCFNERPILTKLDRCVVLIRALTGVSKLRSSQRFVQQTEST